MMSPTIENKEPVRPSAHEFEKSYDDKSQRSYGFLITKELILWLPHFGFFYQFSASLNQTH